MAQQDEYGEDAYAAVGTPFEILETVEDVQKAKARKNKDHYVLDEQGRRRFHGAFTGGFSAGYYNTVGSKEGWTPSTFRSSRGTKSEFSGQKPEDFMDAEDLGTYGIAPREVATRPNFSQRGPKRTRPLDESRSNVIPGEAPLQNLIVPARSSVGARLLRSMGWREGQGVGPRVQRPSVAGEKMYGCSLPLSLAGDRSGDPTNSEVLPDDVRGYTFAPQDVSIRQFEGKDDLHGIGYRGMEEIAVLGRRETKRAVHGMRGEAFGTGALEDDDDEGVEDNVYGVESMTSYDVTLAGDGDVEMERKFGWTGGVEDSWSLASFTKATRALIKPKVYHTPIVPRDFVPIHRFSILNIKTPDTHERASKPIAVAHERNQQLADKPGSVFSLMSAADRERLKRVAGAVASAPMPPTTATQTKPHPPSPPTSSSVAIQPQQTQSRPQTASLGDAAIDGIKPYAHNSLKQARYEAFKKGHSFHSDAESIRMTEWERQRERDEFARMKRVYQPLSVALSTRFTREGGGEEEMVKPPEPDSVQAARAGMFGALTREVLEWHPHRVLCKRFNIPDPYPNDGLVGTVTEKHKQMKAAVKRIQFLPKTDSSGAPGPPTLTTAPENSSLQCTQEAAAETVGGARQPAVCSTETLSAPPPVTRDTNEKEEITAIAEEEERPPMDLFKAIFAGSSSESDTETETLQKGAQDTAASTGKVETNSNETKQHRTRWQDLSAVTNRPLDTTVTHNTTEISAPNKRNIAAADKETVYHVEVKTTAKRELEKPHKLFGPALPPGFGSSTAVEAEGGSERERNEGERHSTHKHKHHKMSRNEKRKKGYGSDEEEKISHKRRKEKKKPKHKH